MNIELTKSLNDLIFELALSIIASTIFYIIVVVIPEQQKEKSTLAVIRPRLKTITNELVQSIHYLQGRLNLNKKNINKLTKEDFNGLTALYNKSMNFKYLITNKENQWIPFSTGDISEIQHFERECILVIRKIDEILALPIIINLNIELIETLAKLRDCWFYAGIKSYAQGIPIITIDNFNNGAYDYYTLYLKLKKFVRVIEFKVTR